jgi:hypothetical protein
MIRDERTRERGEREDFGVGAPRRPPEYEREAVAIDALQRRGYRASFTAEPGGLRLTGSTRLVEPEDVRIREVYRFEGKSDPDDMSVVYALEALDGTRGILIDAYGSYADPNVGAVLDRVPTGAPGRRWRRGRWWTVLVGGAAVGLAVIAALVARRPRGARPEAGPANGGSARPRRAA